MEKHFTATAYIVDEGKTILIFHKKIRKWLPPGGHIDPNETPVEAAIREAYEEVGLHIEIIPNENVWFSGDAASSFERPYLCLLENIDEHKQVPAHQHMDFVYFAKVVGGQLAPQEAEVDGARWFSLEELEALEVHKEIHPETKEIAKHLLMTQYSLRV